MLGEGVESGKEEKVESEGAGVGGEEMTTCELAPGTWMLNEGVGAGDGAEFVLRSLIGRLITGGVLTRAGTVRTPMGRVMSVGAVGMPRKVASAIVLPLPSSMIRSTSVETATACRRRSSFSGGGVTRDAAGCDDVLGVRLVSAGFDPFSVPVGLVKPS